MCGFVGVAWTDGPAPIDMASLIGMRDAIHHRGPDDAGAMIDEGIALASRRLSIIDLSPRGRMPMATPDSRYSIVYNGEVYNFRSLRDELRAQGVVFESDTDTEVLLHLYAQLGPAMLDKLNGMFALAIWDARERSLFLARDRMGIKPLYYAQQGGALWFASEQKALFAAGLSASFDHTAWEELLCFRYVAGENTVFEGVKRLLPGHYLSYSQGQVRRVRWWDMREHGPGTSADDQQNAARWFGAAFDASVEAHRVSDVPIGVLLSGGLDSSALALSLAQSAGENTATFTVRFEEAGYDEGPLAKQVAQAGNLAYNELSVSNSELLGLVEDACWFNDEPLAHGNEPHILAISRYAKPLVTVLLSGEGSDEILGGYMRYRPLLMSRYFGLARLLLPAITPLLRSRPRLQKLARFLKLGSLDQFVLYNSCDVLPDDLRAIGMEPMHQIEFRQRILDEAKQMFPGDPARQAMYCDQHTFLCSLFDRNDRMTMGASIECRVPFIENSIIEGLASLPSSTIFSGKENKTILREAFAHRFPKEILAHHKWGFGVPWNRHFREIPELRKIVSGLPDAEPICSGPFDQAKLRKVIEDFLSGDNRHAQLIRMLALTAIWHRVYFERITTLQSANAKQAAVAGSR